VHVQLHQQKGMISLSPPTICNSARQIKYRNNVIECDHGKLKRIIGATLGFKSMKTAYATIKGIEVMRALRKGQASAFYYGDPLGEMRLVSRVFEM
ncbi:transposase, partial [Enterobacter hormaechei]|uniref:transposase n=1 Tax=Enterobacter hormaechei TaxID=158836 RepID=UPI00214984CE